MRHTYINYGNNTGEGIAIARDGDSVILFDTNIKIEIRLRRVFSHV